jgi:hypothetical protein
MENSAIDPKLMQLKRSKIYKKIGDNIQRHVYLITKITSDPKIHVIKKSPIKNLPLHNLHKKPL